MSVLAEPPARRLERTRGLPRFLISAASLVTLLGVWVVGSQTGLVASATLPSPLAIARAGYTLVIAGFSGSTLQGHLLISLGRFGGGFLLAVLLGAPLGLLMGWSSVVRQAVAPFLETFRFIAPLAWVPFAALWFGTGIGGPIFIVFSGAFAACVINTFRGAQLVDPVLLEASRMLCASPWRLMVDVLLPGSVPAILAGVRISAALGWQALIGAELIAASSGLGYLIVQGQGSLETPIVFAGMAAIAITGFAIDRALLFLCAKFGPQWRLAAP